MMIVKFPGAYTPPALPQPRWRLTIGQIVDLGLFVVIEVGLIGAMLAWGKP